MDERRAEFLNLDGWRLELQALQGTPYGLKAVTLSGIGGMSEALRQAALLYVRTPDGGSKKVLCYAFDKSVGNTKEILLFSLRTIREAKIDIIYHMD